jgi:hypothetical protein
MVAGAHDNIPPHTMVPAADGAMVVDALLPLSR